MEHPNATLMRKVDEALLAGDFPGFLALTELAAEQFDRHRLPPGRHRGGLVRPAGRERDPGQGAGCDRSAPARRSSPR